MNYNNNFIIDAPFWQKWIIIQVSLWYNITFCHTNIQNLNKTVMYNGNNSGKNVKHINNFIEMIEFNIYNIFKVYKS